MFCARAQYRVALLALLAVVSTTPSPASGQRKAVEVRSISIVPGDNGPVLEIVSTRPLTPQLQTVEGPLRLVIDLPNSTLNTARRRIPFRNEQIKAVRVDQYQANPAVTRVVVDLAAPVKYTWDAMGNRLRIRMSADETATAKPPSVPAFTSGVQPAAVPVAIGTSGSLVETGSRVASGSTITAGEETAILRLTRGGEVRVCPGTTVSVSTSPNGEDLMLGMSNGAMETHYGLKESVDSVLTPDFRVVLPGPGEFNLAISTDAHGNTCVGSLPGSTSSAVIAELLGNGTYEIKPDQQVMFRRGRLDLVEPAVASCGCPPVQEPVLRAADPAAVIPEDKAGQKLQLANSEGSAMKSDPPSTSPLPDTSASNPKQDSNPKVQLEATLVFRGRDAQSPPAAPAAPLAEAAALSLTTKPSDPLPAVVVLPPTTQSKTAHKGFFGKVKGFFGGLFH